MKGCLRLSPTLTIATKKFIRHTFHNLKEIFIHQKNNIEISYVYKTQKIYAVANKKKPKNLHYIYTDQFYID